MKREALYDLKGAGLYLLTIYILVFSFLCLFQTGAWAEDVSAYVTVTTANERSTMDRRTRLITSTADVTITNSSDQPINAPLHAVIEIFDTAYSNVSMPNALGGLGTLPYDKYYYDLSAGLQDDKLGPGESTTFQVKFIRFYTVRFRYNVIPYGNVETGPVNQPPTADAGLDITHILPYDHESIEVTLDGSGSSDADGTIEQYLWSGNPTPSEAVSPSVTLGEGIHTFTLIVVDNEGAQSEPDTVVITVNPAPNRPPVITSSPVVSVDEQTSYTYQVMAEDSDADTLTYELLQAPAGMSIEAASGLIDWAPAADQLGSHPVVVQVSDGRGGTDQQAFALEVVFVGECIDGQTRPCSTACGEGQEICVNRTWQTCNAPQPAEEVCDGADNDCDGEIDEGVSLTFYADSDGDTFGDPEVSGSGCSIPEGFVADDQDCDDSDGGINPAAEEIADNGIDEDCDGVDLIGQYGEAWFVDADAPPGGDGLSWGTAFDKIESAIISATEGDEIWVKSGTYHHTNTVFIDKIVHLYGGFAGFETNRDQRDWENNVTIINGGSFKGVGFRITTDATLNGFTISKFWSGLPCGIIERHGGAIMIENASPTISHCTFTENRGLYAGAIYNENTSPEIDASPSISDCIFENNGSLQGGGAIYNRHCSPTISGCRFSGNTSLQAAVMENFHSSPIISSCTFLGNHSFSPNGPIILNMGDSSGDSSPSVSHTDFIGNAGLAIQIIGTAPESAPLINDCSFTGNNPQAVRIERVGYSMPSPIISNSRFYANHGKKYFGDWGSSISVEAATARIAGCLFERNHSYWGAVNISHNSSVVDIRDSVFRDNVSFGGAFVIQNGSEVNILNSLFTGNIVNCAYNRTCGGGAIYNAASSPLIINSTFAGNRTQYRLGEYVLNGGAINNNSTSTPAIINSIFWDNGPKDIWDDAPWVMSPSAAVTNSLIGFYDPSLEIEANHNVEADPNFVDMARDNYRLFPDSPAVDAGTATVPDPPGLPTADLDGNSRILDGDENGEALPDMGAYEYVAGTNEGPPALPPSNTAPVAKADAKMGDEYNVKDYSELQEHHVGDTIQLDGTGSRDENDDPLSYHWSFVHIPTRSAAVLSDPNDAEPTFLIDANGVYALRLVVNDGLLDSEPDFLVIYTLNRLQVIRPAPDITVNVGEPVQLRTDYIEDPDGDPLTYQWCLSPGWPNYELPGRPEGSNVTLDSLRGPDPTFVPDVPGVYSFIVKAFDGYSYAHQCHPPRFFDDHIRCDYIRVYAQVGTNIPPQITSTPSHVATPWVSYSYNITHEDPDDSSVFFTLDTSPPGMFIDHYNPTRVIWRPAADQLGEHEVIIRAVDQRGSYSFQQFSITVLNDPPAIVSSPVTVATERVLYNYQVQATDPDTTYLMRFYLDESPQGMSIHSATGLIQWTPTSIQLGDHPVTVRVEDVAGYPDTQNFTIHVKNNRPPMFVSSPGTAAAEGALYVYPVSVLDEGGALVFSLETPPDGMAIDSASGLVTWTPSGADVGSHDVVVQVTDTMGLTASQSYSLVVYADEAVDRDGDSYSENDGDCDDSNPAIHPGAFDMAGNGVDEDCDGDDAATSIQITSGQMSVDILPDTGSHVGYVASFRSADTGEYHIQFAQTIEPDDGTLAVDTAFPSEITTAGSKSWQVGSTVTGSMLGTYELTTVVTVVETGQSDQVTTLVHVISGEENPVIHPLGSYPDGISIGEATDVLFTSIQTGTTGLPTDIIVEEIDDSSNVIRVLGGLVDDGSSGDLQAGDYVYSGTFNISSGAEGILRFRARAAFPGIAEPVYSGICELYVTRFPTDINSYPPSTIAQDPDTGALFVTDRLLVSFAESTDADTIEAIVNAANGQIIGTLLSLGIFQVAIPDTDDETGVRTAMDALYQYPEVLSIEPVFVGFPAGVTPDDTHYDAEQKALRYIRADEAWVISRGGPVIAVVDGGVDYNHPDLREKVIKGRNFMSPLMTNHPNWDPWDPMDYDGHGTQVAGLAAAMSNNGIGIAGVAWDSKILAVRSSGYRFRPVILYDAALAGIRYAAEAGAKIINFSQGFDKSYFQRTLGHTLNGDEIAIKRVVQHVTERGCLVVAAAGNDNSFSVGYPGAFDTVMCVGAVEVDPDTGAVTRWDETDESGRHGSNYGPDVDIAAPGRRVYSTTLNGSYFHNSGTSFATPLVAGAAAVVWSNYPEWTAQQVRERLEQTAIPLSPGEKDLGAGMVDLFEALFNGSFETGGLHGWDAHSVTGLSPNYAPWGVPVARAIGPIAGFPPPLANYYDPTPRGDINNWMAYIDNSGPDVSGTTISQSFYVQPGVEATAFSFEGYFVTDEYFEWHNVAVNYNCYNDFVEVIVRGPSGSTYPYYRWERISTFNYAPYYQGTDIDIGDPGSVGRPYDHAMPQCWAGNVSWEGDNRVGAARFFERSDVIFFTEGPGEYTIEIFISDATDTIVDSALLIDNIRFR